jgi:hypothetical protein
MVTLRVTRVPRESLASRPWLMERDKSSQHCFCAKCGNDLTGRVECATEGNGLQSEDADRRRLLCVFCGASEVLSAKTFRLGQVHVVQQTTMSLAPPV